MRNVEGVRFGRFGSTSSRVSDRFEARKHSRSVSLAAGVHRDTQCSRARTQYNQTSSSRSIISPESSEAG